MRIGDSNHRSGPKHRLPGRATIMKGPPMPKKYIAAIATLAALICTFITASVAIPASARPPYPGHVAKPPAVNTDWFGVNLNCFDSSGTLLVFYSTETRGAKAWASVPDKGNYRLQSSMGNTVPTTWTELASQPGGEGVLRVSPSNVRNAWAVRLVRKADGYASEASVVGYETRCTLA